MKIADLPFRERPVEELLNLVEYRERPEHDYAGYGWARVPRLVLVEEAKPRKNQGADTEPIALIDEGRVVTDSLLIAVHTADDAPAIANDLQLEFVVMKGPVAVMASKFLATWLPMLPPQIPIVLCVCNPYRAQLRSLDVGRTLWLPMGDVQSWRDHDNGDILLTAENWSHR
jgi:hypothetical protein